MKRIISITLVLMLVLSLSVVAFAAPTDGTITIHTTSKSTTYKIYKLMDLESFEKGKAYAYKVNSAWTDFFTTGYGKDFVSIDADGYVTWTAGEGDAVMAPFAQKALEYAEANSIPASGVQTTADDFAGPSVVFSGLELGWYLVDTTAGALCGLTTTDKDAVINAKNNIPTIDKQVKEDLDGEWHIQNTADIGQIVEYKTTITVAAGAQNYVLHDELSAGLTFVHDVAKGRGVTRVEVIHSDSTHTVLTEGTDYTVKTSGFADGCTFEVVFAADRVKTLLPNERVVVYYNAMLNRHAVIAGANLNETYLEYGEEHYTESDFTETYTYSFDIVKTDSSNQLINGAKFRIYDAATGGNEVGVVPLMEADEVTPVKDANGNQIYRRARPDEQTGGMTVDIVVNGSVTIVGFDNGVYYLEEIEAPDGYNKLTSRQMLTIANANLDAIFDGGIYSKGSGVQVVNKTGSMLPETGAMGTAMFITFGTIVVLGAGVLLVTKKRMGMIQD